MSMTEDLPFNLLIREARIEAGLDQLDLAVTCGVTRGTVTHWEVGNKCPTERHLQRLASVFGLDESLLAERVLRDRPGRRVLHPRSNRCRSAGHPRTDDNSYLRNGIRVCRLCSLSRAAAGRDNHDRAAALKLPNAVEPRGKRDSCRSGHLYTDENTYFTTHGRRGCRICHLARAARRRGDLERADKLRKATDVPRRSKGVCQVVGCERHGRVLCGTHAYRMAKWGNPGPRSDRPQWVKDIKEAGTNSVPSIGRMADVWGVKYSTARDRLRVLRTAGLIPQSTTQKETSDD